MGEEQGDQDLLEKIENLTETLKQERYQNSMLLRWVNGAVIIVDREGHVVEANAAALDALGWNETDFVGRHMHETIHHSQEDGSEYPWDFCPVFAAIEDGSSHHVDGDVFWQKNGASFSADFIVCPNRDERNAIIGAVLIFRNITEQRLSEAKRIQSMKLEAIGELAAGIAHEINTPIQFIGSNLSFLKEGFDSMNQLFSVYSRLKDDMRKQQCCQEKISEIEEMEESTDIEYLREEIPKAFLQTQDGVERVSKLVLGLKRFAHSGSDETKRPEDINEIIANSLIVCHNAYKYVAEMETDYGELPPAYVHSGDIGQVVINLVVNAAHAIADHKKDESELGRITIRTSHENGIITIAVTDTGVGIPEGIRQRIFDPFYTTKEVGRGSGQGLAISRFIINEKHQGDLTFESAVGKGSTFTIMIPVKGS